MLERLGIGDVFRLAVEKSENVVDGAGVKISETFDGRKPKMRRKHRVRQIAERIVRRQRLSVIDIERGNDSSGTSGRNQRLLIDNRTARGVDQNRALFHQREFGAADE